MVHSLLTPALNQLPPHPQPPDIIPWISQSHLKLIQNQTHFLSCRAWYFSSLPCVSEWYHQDINLGVTLDISFPQTFHI